MTDELVLFPNDDHPPIEAPRAPQTDRSWIADIQQVINLLCNLCNATEAAVIVQQVGRGSEAGESWVLRHPARPELVLCIIVHAALQYHEDGTIVLALEHHASGEAGWRWDLSALDRHQWIMSCTFQLDRPPNTPGMLWEPKWGDPLHKAEEDLPPVLEDCILADDDEDDACLRTDLARLFDAWYRFGNGDELGDNE